MGKAFKKVIFIFVFALTVSSVFANDFKYSNLRIFYGNLHSHTLFSDGRGTPEQAYQHASKYGDVLAVTDHCYFLKIFIDGKSKTYLTQQAARNSSINGKFVGLQGFEWTAGSGHINVYETLEYISRDEK
ncbi:MAG: phosphotransferase, partial [Fervidobacterium sp.]